jgi:methylamine methyltransferase corrinoid protein reductive activase
MTDYGIALDIGTSGFRAQAIDLTTCEVISTAITTHHPIPGANVIDHVNYAIDAGSTMSNRLIIDTVNKLLLALKIDLTEVRRMAVCGNPFQLSLFQNIEIRDLAYAGKNKLDALGVVPPKRDGAIVSAKELGLDISPDASVMIPPAVSHEIGADALAMLLMTGAIEQVEPCLVVDYGTNAEMALIMNGEVYTGSAAAGPALEGQQIMDGMLASPGAISDVTVCEDGWSCTVLDEEFVGRQGDVIDPLTGNIVRKGEMHGRAIGITGTGVVAVISCGIDTGLIRQPKILSPDSKIHLQDGIILTEKDVEEAGKAIGALRAGYLTLMREVGLWTDDVRLSYMSGASGLYVDAHKAQKIGMVPSGAARIIQLGNTSLALAKELVINPKKFDDLKVFAKDMRARHCMFATSETFKNIYSIELSLWSYGMPVESYDEMLDIYNYPHLRIAPVDSSVQKMMSRDIPDLGRFGISILTDVGIVLCEYLDGCLLCRKCEEECPEAALRIEESGDRSLLTIKTELCSGTACRRCEMRCPAKIINLKKMVIKG